ncbi:MAG: ParB/RepB/Spo0J family partition protein [Clostridiales bacterium]|nr:ParB/RepB/Spo0J family partition protein [Clostridiales bacterium]
MAAPNKTRGLGKGLDALFGDAEVSLQPRQAEKPVDTIVSEERVGTAKAKAAAQKEAPGKAGGITYVGINDIKPNSNQPRKTFNEEKLDELAASIEAHGLIQPVVLRTVNKGYEIVAGERRWRAARKLGIKEIPCIIKELTDEENMLLAIIENMQREDLNPIEEAEGLSQMIDTYGLTQEQVSKSIGKSRPYITNTLRLLKLPEAIRDFVSEGCLSVGHARALITIEDERRQIAIAEEAMREGLSVRQIERMSKENKGTGRAKVRVKQKDADTKRVEEDLKEALGTKVTLNQKGRKGRIEIEYYSKEELERLIELLRALK